MKMSQAGLDNLLKKFEGCRLRAYKDPIGIWTIGYGHTSAAGEPIVKEGLTIRQAEAEEILRRDLGRYEVPVAALVKVELEQHQFDVLVDFAYNAGVGNLKSSTLLKKVNAEDFDAVPKELMKWTKAAGKELPGLVRRRQAEIAWWSAHHEQPGWSAHYEQPLALPEQRVEPDPVPVKSIVESKQANSAIAIGALGSVGAAKEVLTQAQDASDTFAQLLGLLKSPNFLMMLAIVGLGAAIWYWRKQNLDKHGV